MVTRAKAASLVCLLFPAIPKKVLVKHQCVRPKYMEVNRDAFEHDATASSIVSISIDMLEGH